MNDNDELIIEDDKNENLTNNRSDSLTSLNGSVEINVGNRQLSKEYSMDIDDVEVEDASNRRGRLRRLTMPLIYQMYESQYDDLSGTVVGPDSPHFRPELASETLRKALSGI
ncbi:unnamed protein product, partial [Anisakis simplex]